MVRVRIRVRSKKMNWSVADGFDVVFATNINLFNTTVAMI